MSTTKKIVIAAVGTAVLAGAAFAARKAFFDPESPTFRFATIERGDIQAVVSATGTLGAVTTVSVGTQVSGQISALYVDFNDQVKKGELLARVDPTIAQQAVADAQANLEKLQAQTNQAKRDQDRNRELSQQGLIPASQNEQGEAALKVAEAGEKSASIALQKARQNLSYTNIYAPIDGVVVERNVNLGQTVAASLQAPQLFLIANDLSHMQILAQVSESDIDKIDEGQTAKFTVQAIADRTFTGVVDQVRLQSTTVDNVVNYTVVIKLDNPNKELLPGMTARVDFQVKSVTGVLKVANAALRYKPSEEILEQVGQAAAPEATNGGSGAGRRQRGGDATANASPSGSSSPAAAAATGTSAEPTQRGNRGGRPAGARGNFGTLYSLDPDGKLKAHRVRVGLSDGTSTEIEGRDISEGMKVIVGIATAATSNQSQTNNPLLPSRNTGGRGRGPGGGGGF